MVCTDLLVGLVQLVVYIWTVITFPVYWLIYQPWKKRAAFNRKRATQVDTRANEVTYRCVPRPCAMRSALLNNKEPINTMDKLLKFLFNKYSTNKCLGTRNIMEEKKVEGPSGKMLTKLVQADDYTWMNYSDLDNRSTYIGRGLRTLGLKARDKLVMYCDTKAEWMVTAAGCFKFNFTLVTIYTNLGEDGVAYGINQTQANYVCTSQELLPKLIKILDQLPTVTNIIVIEEPWKGEVELLDAKWENSKALYTWRALFKAGKEATGMESTPPLPNDTAILMYTSGSTGNPKGVMLTHNNIVNALLSFAGLAEHAVGKVKPDDTYIAYLPLAHVLELLAEHVMLLLGVAIGYSSPNTLTDTSTMVLKGAKGDAPILKPSIMCAVPVILDRIYKGINAKIAAGGPLKAKLVDFCVRYRSNWIRRGYDTPIMNRLIFGKMKAIVGGRVKVLLSGGAPLAEEAHSFIRTALCCQIHQGYGLTETSSTATVTEEDDISVGRVGTPLQGVDIKLVDWSEGGYTVRDSQGPRGEIIVGGAHVAAGYYNMPDKTAEEFYDQDGKRWFKTGDVGQVMPDGTFKIIDRKKDLVKLQMGEYVSLGKVESNLKIHTLVDNICVYARPTENFAVALLVPDRIKLAELAHEVGAENKSFDELCLDPSVNKEVLRQLTIHGTSMGLEKFEMPKRVTLLTDEWTPDSGMVTAAMKLKRKAIEAAYQQQLDSLYTGQTHTVKIDLNMNNNKDNNNKVHPK